MKRGQRKRQSQIAEKEHRGEELGRRRVEDPRESHSTEQSDRKAQPTAGEKSTVNSSQQQQKSIPNSRGESKEQSEQCQLQAETYEENNASKKEVRTVTRNKDIESHRHIATEQELKVVETARENQVEIEEEIEVEKQKAAELRKPGADSQEIA